MKKLIYSGLAFFMAAAAMVGCKDDNNGGGGTDGPKGPSIEFQTNTGTFSGYTFANGSAQIGTTIKIGTKVNSTDVNIKSTKMTVKYANQAEQLVGTDSIIAGNSKSVYREYLFVIPPDKGTYTFTVYATDKNATTSSTQIVIQAFGPLTERGSGFRVYSLQSTTQFSAFDLFSGEAISAGSGAGNNADRDIVDMSTNTALSASWKSDAANGTQFVISGADGKLNGKTYLQFQSEDEIKAAWDAAATKSSTITGVDIGKLIIAKSTRSGATTYYLIGIDEVQDLGGSEDDFIEFHYKN
jgi:hypothetical protein